MQLYERAWSGFSATNPSFKLHRMVQPERHLTGNLISVDIHRRELFQLIVAYTTMRINYVEQHGARRRCCFGRTGKNSPKIFCALLGSKIPINRNVFWRILRALIIERLSIRDRSRLYIVQKSSIEFFILCDKMAGHFTTDFYGHYCYVDKHDLEILRREFVTYMRSEMKSLHVTKLLRTTTRWNHLRRFLCTLPSASLNNLALLCVYLSHPRHVVVDR